MDDPLQSQSSHTKNLFSLTTVPHEDMADFTEAKRENSEKDPEESQN
jgi:hypothetical protein